MNINFRFIKEATLFLINVTALIAGVVMIPEYIEALNWMEVNEMFLWGCMMIAAIYYSLRYVLRVIYWEYRMRFDMRIWVTNKTKGTTRVFSIK